MCGIIHCKKRNTKANKTVIKRFENQKSRGTQGFGYVELVKGYVVGEVRTQTEKEIMQHLKTSVADEIMFHHRIPTSTPNFIESTHPIKVSNPILKYNYYVIHNGMISNDSDMRKEHLDLGFVYTTDTTKKYETRGTVYYDDVEWNDSESLAIDFAIAIENDMPMKSKGSIALIALQYEKKTGKAISLFWGHNAGNPLKIEDAKEFLCLSSETGKDVETDYLFEMSYANGVITKQKRDIGTYTYVSSYTKGDSYNGYDYGYDYGYGRSYKNRTGYNTSTTKEENDFTYADLSDEMYELKQAKRQAELSGDIDMVNQIDEEIFDLQLEIDAWETENPLLLE